MTAPTSAQGALRFPARSSSPPLMPKRWFIHHLKLALRTSPITFGQHQKGSTAAPRQLHTESSQCVHWELQEIRVTRLSKTLSRRRTVEICSTNIPSTLPRTNLLPPRPWNQKRVRTCRNIATTEPQGVNPLRIAPTPDWCDRKPITEGTYQTSQWVWKDIFMKTIILMCESGLNELNSIFLMQHYNQGKRTGHSWAISGNYYSVIFPNAPNSKNTMLQLYCWTLLILLWWDGYIFKFAYTHRWW